MAGKYLREPSIHASASYKDGPPRWHRLTWACYFCFPFFKKEERMLQRLCLLKGVGVSRNFPWPDLTSLSRHFADTSIEETPSSFRTIVVTSRIWIANDCTLYGRFKWERRDNGMTVRRKLSLTIRYLSNVCDILTCLLFLRSFYSQNFINVSFRIKLAICWWLICCNWTSSCDFLFYYMYIIRILTGNILFLSVYFSVIENCILLAGISCV